jgi:hypothetical protein
MTGWRDARVVAAEEALDAAVRTADDVIAAAGQDDPAPEPASDLASDLAPDEQRSVLRDAW